MNTRTAKNARFLTHAGVIAALYVALTMLAALFGLSGTNAIQVRISEALCILPFFTAAAIPGLTIGCLLANVATSAMLPDIIFGTLATLIGALGTYLLRRFHYLFASLPPILANTIIVPFVIRYAYMDVDASLPFLFLPVGIGEIISVGVLGTALLLALKPHAKGIFKNSK